MTIVTAGSTSMESLMARQLDAQDLYIFPGRFVSSNGNSPHVDRRWLAAYAGDLKTMAFHVKNNQRDTIKKQVNEFRLREIDEAKQKLHAEADKLETEEAKLLREIEQIAVTGNKA